MSKIFAPFSPEQVESLNGFQHSDHAHPFTCGGSVTCRSTLVATEAGWECPNKLCGYTQNWAHDFMADGSWKKHANEVENLLKRAREKSDGSI